MKGIMDQTLNVLELLTFAISIEEQGVKFYEDLAALNEAEDVKKFMIKLANDEKQHAAVFQKIYDEVSKDENVYDYLYDENVNAIFNDYAKYTAFNREVMEDHSVNEAIKVAVETEKITMAYYQTMLQYAKPKLVPILERLIKEESGHYEELSALLK